MTRPLAAPQFERGEFLREEDAVSNSGGPSGRILSNRRSATLLRDYGETPGKGVMVNWSYLFLIASAQ
jgi:hypothetical protein